MALFLLLHQHPEAFTLARAQWHNSIIGARKAAAEWAQLSGRRVHVYCLKYRETLDPTNPVDRLEGDRAAAAEAFGQPGD